MSDIIVCVKSNDICAKQTIEQFTPPWYQTEYLIRREVDMLKEHDTYIRYGLTNHLWDQHQLVVVYPDDIITPR